jgi:hypothetical protein
MDDLDLNVRFLWLDGGSIKYVPVLPQLPRRNYTRLSDAEVQRRVGFWESDQLPDNYDLVFWPDGSLLAFVYDNFSSTDEGVRELYEVARRYLEHTLALPIAPPNLSHVPDRTGSRPTVQRFGSLLFGI